MSADRRYADELVGAWLRNQHINRVILDSVSDEGLEAVPLLKSGEPGRGRTVRRQFAHMHNVRVSQARSPAKGTASAVTEFERGADPERETLIAALEASTARVAELLERAASGEIAIRKFGGSPAMLLAYLVSHEGHHRGQIMLALKQNGIARPDQVKWGIWSEWAT